MRQKKNATTLLTYIALLIGSVIMIFPFVWMLLTSFKTNAEVMQIPPTILPANWDFSSFSKVVDLLPFGNLYLNTALMIFLRVVCAVVFCSMAGYAFAKLNFKGKNILFTLIIVQQMISGTDFHYSAVPDDCEDGDDGYHIFVGISGCCQCVRDILSETGVYGDSG